MGGIILSCWHYFKDGKEKMEARVSILYHDKNIKSPITKEMKDELKSVIIKKINEYFKKDRKIRIKEGYERNKKEIKEWKKSIKQL